MAWIAGINWEGGFKIEERGIYVASRSKFIEGAAKLESVALFHVEATQTSRSVGFLESALG